MKETLYYNENGILVSNSRIKIDSTTYPLNAITSVTVVETKPKPPQLEWLGYLMYTILITVVALLFIATIRFVASSSEALAFAALCIAVIAVSIFSILRRKPLRAHPSIFAVQIVTNAGQFRVLTSNDKAAICRVVSAVNDAIVDRG